MTRTKFYKFKFVYYFEATGTVLSYFIKIVKYHPPYIKNLNLAILTCRNYLKNLFTMWPKNGH